MRESLHSRHKEIAVKSDIQQHASWQLRQANSTRGLHHLCYLWYSRVSFTGLHLSALQGFHRFYTGDYCFAFEQCLTCGACWIWSINDWVLPLCSLKLITSRSTWSTTSRKEIVQPGHSHKATESNNFKTVKIVKENELFQFRHCLGLCPDSK